MNPRRLLPALLTFLFFCCFTSVNAQCQKSKSSCSKTKSEQTTRSSCTKSKSYSSSSCTKSRSYTSCKEKKQDKATTNNFSNTLVLLGGAAFDPDQNTPAATAGLEYERRFNNLVGAGMLGEFSFSDDPSARVVVPFSYRVIPNLKVSAGPLANFQRQDVINNDGSAEDPQLDVTKEWEMKIGARTSIAYEFNTNGLIIAPAARVDFVGEKIVPSVGVNVGFGF